MRTTREPSYLLTAWCIDMFFPSFPFPRLRQTPMSEFQTAPSPTSGLVVGDGSLARYTSLPVSKLNLSASTLFCESEWRPVFDDW